MYLFNNNSIINIMNFNDSSVAERSARSSGPGFESRSGDLQDLFLVVLSSNPRPHL